MTDQSNVQTQGQEKKNKKKKEKVTYDTFPRNIGVILVLRDVKWVKQVGSSQNLCKVDLNGSNSF